MHKLVIFVAYWQKVNVNKCKNKCCTHTNISPGDDGGPPLTSQTFAHSSPPTKKNFPPVDFPSPSFYHPHQKTIFMFNTNFHDIAPQKISYLAAVIVPVPFLF